MPAVPAARIPARDRAKLPQYIDFIDDLSRPSGREISGVEPGRGRLRPEPITVLRVAITELPTAITDLTIRLLDSWKKIPQIYITFSLYNRIALS